MDNILKHFYDELNSAIIYGENYYTYSSEEVDELMEDLNFEIKLAAQKMYDDYSRDNELDVLINDNAENDWYREYLNELYLKIEDDSKKRCKSFFNKKLLKIFRKLLMNEDDCDKKIKILKHNDKYNELIEKLSDLYSEIKYS